MLDWRPVHVQIYFEDGKIPTDVGYGPQGDDDTLVDNRYVPVDSEYYDDELLRKAVEIIRKDPKWNKYNYREFTHNCQDFVDEVIDAYEDLYEQLSPEDKKRIDDYKKKKEEKWKKTPFRPFLPINYDK